LVVIVHPSIRETLSRSDLAAIFTTRKQAWSGGKKVIPFNFPAKHEYRVAFDQTILRMDPDAVARYWIDRRIRGGNAPPKQVPSAQVILRLVEKLDGAVAYIPRDLVSNKVRIAADV
jgi:hypothetical protein